MLSTEQITQQIINQLRLHDPAVSAEIGTPERKLIEATAELIASQQVDFTVLNQQTDISAMSGGRLDAYLSVYNFGRQQATPAYGTVTFSRTTPATAAIVIPQGTQVIANIDDTVFPSLTFVTTQTVVISAGGTEVSSPAQCTIAGSIGNIDAHKMVGFAGLVSISGISSVSNDQAFAGGTDQEDDATYVTRFKNTFLRNVAGTEDQYLALALSLNSISKANVVGAISRYQEYVQIPAADDAKQLDPDYAIDHGLSIGTVTFPGSNKVFHTAHGLQVNDVVRFTNSGGALPSGLTVGTQYYVITIVDADNFKVSATQGGSSVTISGAGTGTHTAYKAVYPHKRTTALSTIPYSKYTYATNFYLTDGTLNPATAHFFLPGKDYLFNTPPWNGTTGAYYSSTTYTPNVTFLNPKSAVNTTGDALLPENGVFLLEHAYLSENSRNNYEDYGILNCIDVFVNGENPQTVDSVEVVPIDNRLQNTDTTLWTYQKTDSPEHINFRRKIDGKPAGINNTGTALDTSMIQPLYWQPVIDIPDSIIIGTNTYYKANYFNPGDSIYYNQYDPAADVPYTFKAHYILVEEVNSYYGTIRGRSGIEWFLDGDNYLKGRISGDPDDGLTYNGVEIDTQAGQQFDSFRYLYDRNISDLQAIMDQNKQTTADVLVHKARLRYFRPIVTIMYSPGATQSVVNASIVATLANYFETQYYGTAIQLSDILQVIHNTPGVDNVRWTNNSATVGWGSSTGALEEVHADGSSFGTPIFKTDDFYIKDNELAASPSANEVTITGRAQNTWSL